MNYTISMTDILLAVSVGCNLWFLFLLLYERIMDTRIVRFFKGIVGLWRSTIARLRDDIEKKDKEMKRMGDRIARNAWHLLTLQPIP